MQDTFRLGGTDLQSIYKKWVENEPISDVSEKKPNDMFFEQRDFVGEMAQLLAVRRRLSSSSIFGDKISGLWKVENFEAGFFHWRF